VINTPQSLLILIFISDLAQGEAGTKFDFGSANTIHGFTAVTPADVYTPEKG